MLGRRKRCHACETQRNHTVAWREAARCALHLLHGEVVIRDRQHGHPLGRAHELALPFARQHPRRVAAALAATQLELEQMKRGLGMAHRLVVLPQLRAHGADVEVRVGGLVRRLALGLDVERSRQVRQRHLGLPAPPVVARDVVQGDREQRLVLGLKADGLRALEQPETFDVLVLLQHPHRDCVRQVRRLLQVLLELVIDGVRADHLAAHCGGLLDGLERGF